MNCLHPVSVVLRFIVVKVQGTTGPIYSGCPVSMIIFMSDCLPVASSGPPIQAVARQFGG